MNKAQLMEMSESNKDMRLSSDLGRTNVILDYLAPFQNMLSSVGKAAGKKLRGLTDRKDEPRHWKTDKEGKVYYFDKQGNKIYKGELKDERSTTNKTKSSD